MRPVFRPKTLVLALAAVATGGGVRGELSPQEVAIVAARGQAESEGLARHYAQVRGIPDVNICLIDVPAEEEASRDLWHAGIRPGIRAWLNEHDPGSRIRCLTTVRGVPLKIGAASIDGELKRYRDFLATEQKSRLELLSEAEAAFDRLAVANAESAADEQGGIEQSGRDSRGGGDAASLPAGARLAKLQLQLNHAALRAQERIDELPAGAAQLESQNRLKQLVEIIGGSHAILQSVEGQIARSKEPDPVLSAELNRLRGVNAGLVDSKTIVEARPAGVERDSLALAAVEKVTGQLGAIAWIEAQLAIVDQNESGASFDSELALVLWPDDYQLLRWQPNYLRPGFDHSALRQAYPTMMVARLDGPTAAIAQGLADAAADTERAGGLTGTAYIDARGLARLDGPAASSDADFDRALLITAQGLQSDGLEVVLNEGPGLFRKGECPGAALYCGWYSLNKYVDAFDWQRGAIGFHLGGVELRSLRPGNTQQWCRRMLEDGAGATLGPVSNPTMAAFPRPEEFFALVARGELTLAECYWRTVPYTSWQMVLVGDPLYRPYAARAAQPSGGTTPAAE